MIFKTVKEIKEELSSYPDDAIVYTDTEVISIHVDNEECDYLGDINLKKG